MAIEKGLVVINKEVNAVLKNMEAIVVKNDEQYAETAEFCKKCKATQKIVKEFFKEDLEEAKERVKEIKDSQDEYLDRLETAESIAKDKMKAYFEMKLEAKRKAEEKARIKAEEKREEELKKLRDAGEKEKAKELESMELVVKETKREVPKEEGVSYRENWKAEITDFMALVQGVADGSISPDFLVANTVELNTAARFIKKEVMLCAGVKIVKELVPVVR